jgi:hypothetical protein
VGFFPLECLSPPLEVLEVGDVGRRAEVFAEIDPVFFWDGGKNFDDLGVDLGAGAAANSGLGRC